MIDLFTLAAGLDVYAMLVLHIVWIAVGVAAIRWLLRH